jgi:hypothetical protein
MMNPQVLVEKTPDVELLREMIGFAYRSSGLTPKMAPAFMASYTTRWIAITVFGIHRCGL